MTHEIRTIEVVAIRNPEGNPVCAVDWYAPNGKCQFLSTMRWGQVPCCLATGCTIPKRAYTENGAVVLSNEKGWLVPVDDCPVWKERA